ncbi:response regulator transcription factor [Sphingobium sp. BYY-5]|uniref:response regulator transcription factor n=1 Tax=Sphingobium sp. BYY-5 TaxID=2926400 RepID=UPI001FA6CF35|nr:response regulator transcription factor [Sphingobium sp. BYY-5]MCI4590815.1 response regulator transcription factor [Sphingobium sp. BYY-5]
MNIAIDPEETPPVVHIIDDDVSVRLALEDLLASVGLEARSFASTGAFLEKDIPDAPGCLILDVRMPGQSGLDFQRQMVSLGISLPVIFITGHGDVPMSVRAMKDGAIEFLMKPFDDQALIDAIHSGIGRDRLRRAAERDVTALQARHRTLTPGEDAVMELVVKGLLNKQIAGLLHVSEITVKVRRRQVMLKMGATSLPQLVRIFDLIASGR